MYHNQEISGAKSMFLFVFVKQILYIAYILNWQTLWTNYIEMKNMTEHMPSADCIKYIYTQP